MKKNTPDSSDIDRVPSGIPGLDSMIEGGFVKNSTNLLQGCAGAAKTLFSLQHLYYGASVLEEPSVYLSFTETEKALLRHASVFKWDFKSLIAKKKFLVIHFEPHEIVRTISEGGGVIWDTMESIGAKRLVIDSLSAYELYFEKPYLANQSILSFFEQLTKLDVTTLLTMEIPVTPNRESSDRAEFLTDGVINLYNLRRNHQHHRALEVLKMRDTNHSTEVKLFSIGAEGIKVHDGPL